MTLQSFNGLSQVDRHSELLRCCGATRWVAEMISSVPFDSMNEILAASDKAFRTFREADWREAFDHHPAIGDAASMRDKFESTASWAMVEQSGVQEASEESLHELLRLNGEYKKKFGYIFIVNATEKSAADMLTIIKQRILNEPPLELPIAATEQRAITEIRLKKLFS